MLQLFMQQKQQFAAFATICSKLNIENVFLAANVAAGIAYRTNQTTPKTYKVRNF